ncbi:MAG: general secretion pathway protein GspE [Sulfuricurvum sp. PC08-66]|nr:MAG: general secretion pathway protein GspE [Sulfuricurvum sp. PC08-66]
MIAIPTLEHLDLTPLSIEGIDATQAMKHLCIFTTIDETPYAIFRPEHTAQALGFLAKIDTPLSLAYLDDHSYERLYHRALEIKTESELENVPTNQESESDEEIDLTSFLKNSSDILTSEESAPIIKFVNALFYQAVKKGASDIHIESLEFNGEVRFRVDGVMARHALIDKNIAPLIISRIKIISNLDISEKRIPQDGRTQITIAGKSLDIRVSILPSYYGERVVMRILMQSNSIPTLEGLGFESTMTAKFRELLRFSHGMILVTGPTGSGKSTTMHSFLQTIASPDKNIMTAEDPVEYNAENITQVQVNTKVGLTFASALRSMLRQDPDVIMVGEIRDAETAQIAIQAALTGHLLISTLHTNTATAAITRLLDIGVDKFLISTTLRGVLAQRLVRRLCEHCKVEDAISEEYATAYHLPQGAQIYKPKGCAKCNYTGYAGRIAVGELFIMNDRIKLLIKDEASDVEIRAAMREMGMVTLEESIKRLLLEHRTSLEEAIRVGIKEH